MAKKMYAEPTDPEDPGQEMPDNEETPLTLCQKWFNDYLEKPLEQDIKVAEGAAKVGCLGYDEGKISTQLRVCRLEDARKVRGEYLGIKNCISTTLSGHAAGVVANVTLYAEKEKALAEKLNKVLESVKAVKVGMAAVHGLSCKLETARKDSCNSEQCKAIDKGLPAVEGIGGLERFNSSIDEYRETISTLNGNADSLFEMSIKYAGIQASTNVATITPMAEKLKTDAEGLATDVTDQCTGLDKKIGEQGTALADEITGLSSALYTRHGTSMAHDFLTALKGELESVVDQQCADLDYATAKDELTQYCEAAITTFDTTSGCDEEGGGNKFNIQDAPSC